jgi:hypothetical protein
MSSAGLNLVNVEANAQRIRAPQGKQSALRQFRSGAFRPLMEIALGLR